MNIACKALQWKIWGKWVRLRLDSPPSAKTKQAPVLPPRLWGARRVTIALEPPVQGRSSVVLETRFCCASALSFAEPLYREVRRAIRDSHDWERLEYELRMLIGQRGGYSGSLFVIFVTTDDVVLMGLMHQDRMFLQRVVEPPLRQVATMQAGMRDSADTLIALVNPDDFARIFETLPPAPPRAVIPAV